jgi:hypothetical protein
MKELAVIFAVFVSSFGFGQDLDDGGRFKVLQDSINKLESQKPSLKQGDDDMIIKPLFTKLFKDTIAFDIILNHPSLNNFYVVSDLPVREKILFKTWFVELQKYGSMDNIEIKQRIQDDIMSFFFYQKGILVRKITIFWDQSYNGIDYVNLRHITDQKY